MSSSESHPSAPATLTTIEHVLERCAVSTRSEALESLLRDLQLELSRLLAIARTEFSDALPSDPPPEGTEPYADAALGLVALTGAIDRSLRAHEEARVAATDLRAQGLIDGQLERLRAMTHQIARHSDAA